MPQYRTMRDIQVGVVKGSDRELLMEALRFAVRCSCMETEDPRMVEHSCNLCLKAAAKALSQTPKK